MDFEVEGDYNDDFPSEQESSEDSSDSETEDNSSRATQGRSKTSLCRRSRSRFGPVVNESVTRLTNNNASYFSNKDDNLQHDEPAESQAVQGRDPGVAAADRWDQQRIEYELSKNNRKMEAKLDNLTNALEVMQDMVKKSGMNTGVNRKSQGRSQPLPCETTLGSGTTIYQPAIKPLDSREVDPTIQVNEIVTRVHNAEGNSLRFSSSSDEALINTSDEFGDEAIINTSLIPVEAAQAVPGPSNAPTGNQPERRGYSTNTPQLAVRPPVNVSRAEQMIREAKASKAENPSHAR